MTDELLETKPSAHHGSHLLWLVLECRTTAFIAYMHTLSLTKRVLNHCITELGQGQQATCLHCPCRQAQLSVSLILQPDILSCALLQLIYLDVGVNNITGTLPRSWSKLTQASTVTTVYICICM